MNALLLDTAALALLFTLNDEGPPERKLEPVVTTDGRNLLNADLLQDCAPGQTWEFYHDFLEILPIVQVPLEDFPTAEVIAQ